MPALLMTCSHDMQQVRCAVGGVVTALGMYTSVRVSRSMVAAQTQRSLCPGVPSLMRMFPGCLALYVCCQLIHGGAYLSTRPSAEPQFVAEAASPDDEQLL